MNNRLVEGVERLAGVRVLVVGDAMLDHYIVGDVQRISPEAPVPILRVEKEFDRVGGAANVAVNVVRLSGDAKLVALAGGAQGQVDSDGSRLLEKCSESGVDATLLAHLPCTIRKARLMAGAQQMLRVDWEDKRPHEFACDAAQTAQKSETISTLLRESDVVLVSDYAKGAINKSVMELVVASGLPVIVDPRPQNSELYRGVGLITPNRKEACQMLGISTDSRATGEELGKQLGDKLGCSVLVTLGEDGMCLTCKDNTCENIPTRAQEVFDVTGAGDTVAATVALAIGAGMSMSDAAHMANAAAGIVVGHVGTASVTPDELRAAILNEPKETK